MTEKIEISPRTIIFTFVIGGAVWLFFQIEEILLALFIALILMSALNPYVKWLEKKRLPRWAAVLLLYIIGLVVLGSGLGGIIPPLVSQTTSLIEKIPEFLRLFRLVGIDEKVIAGQISAFTSIPANIVKFIVGLFSNIIAVIALAMVTFYLLIERKSSKDHFRDLLGEEKAEKAEILLDRVEQRIGGWVRGEIILMFLVGFLSYLGYSIIGIDYAIPLAILAFALEIVPNIGPVLAAFPAVLVGLAISPLHALAITGWCILVQQLENIVFVPRVMKQTAGVNPVISILSLAIGLKLAGIGGAVLAIPTYITIRTIVEELAKNRHS